MNTIFIALLSLISLGSMAKSDEESRNSNFWTQVIKNKVAGFVSESLNNEKGVVIVDYSISTEGKVVINEIVSSNSALEEHVVNQLKKVQVNNLSGKTIDERIISKYKFRGIEKQFP